MYVMFHDIQMYVKFLKGKLLIFFCTNQLQLEIKKLKKKESFESMKCSFIITLPSLILKVQNLESAK